MKLLLISNSTSAGQPYLAWPESLTATVAGEPVGGTLMQEISAMGEPLPRYLTTIPDQEKNPQRRALLEAVNTLVDEQSRHGRPGCAHTDLDGCKTGK